MRSCDIAIIGSGTAGLSAAVYAARANMSTLVFTGEAFGGQIATTHDVENYPGFEAGITGPELTDRMRAQAERFGSETVFDHIETLETDGPPFTLRGRADSYQAKAVIAATGATAKRLGVPGEERFWGRGVSTCATCDAAFFKDAPTALVGGGDSAMQEGLFLARFASKVYVIHRRDELRAGATLAERAFSEPKLEFVWNSVVEEIVGESVVEHVRVRNLQTGRIRSCRWRDFSSSSDTNPIPISTATSWTSSPVAIYGSTSKCTPRCREYLPPVRSRMIISDRPSPLPARG